MYSGREVTTNLSKLFTNYPFTKLTDIFFWEWSVCNSSESAQGWFGPVYVWVTDRHPVVTWHTIIGIVTWDWGDHYWRVVVFRDIHQYYVQDLVFPRWDIHTLSKSQATGQ